MKQVRVSLEIVCTEHSAGSMLVRDDRGALLGTLACDGVHGPATANSLNTYVVPDDVTLEVLTNDTYGFPTYTTNMAETQLCN